MTIAEELQAFRLACVEAGARDVGEVFCIQNGRWLQWFYSYYGRDSGGKMEVLDYHASAIVVRHFEDELLRIAKDQKLFVEFRRLSGGVVNANGLHQCAIGTCSNSGVAIWKEESEQFEPLILSGLQALSKWREQNES